MREMNTPPPLTPGTCPHISVWIRAIILRKNAAHGVVWCLPYIRMLTSGASLQLYERKRELEVDAAIKAAEARDRVTQAQLAQLPEHQQQHLQVRPIISLLFAL